jgi:hypothetical protein
LPLLQCVGTAEQAWVISWPVPGILDNVVLKLNVEFEEQLNVISTVVGA